MTLRKGRAPTKKAQAEAKARSDIQARYDAAGTGRRIAHWMPGAHGPNKAIEGLQRIRNRSRDSSRNDWAGESPVQKWTTTLVGVGITPRWKNEKIQNLWAKSAGEIDADGVSTFDGLVALGVRTWLDGGEALQRRRPRNPLTSTLHVPLQVQLIEGDFMPIFDSTTWPGMPVGHEIYQGWEVNRSGQRVAAYVYKSHPGDRPGGGVPNPMDLVRVLARDLSHAFEPRRPGQMRGVPLLAGVLTRLRNSVDLEDAVLDRQKLANLFTMFITKQLPDDWEGWDIDEQTGMPKVYGRDGSPMVGLEPGMSQELKPGEDVKFANPPEAGTTFSEYMRTTHLGTASGLGMPYEIMGGDIKDVSDRTLRVLVNEFRRFAEQRQWHIVIPKICQPPVKWWAEAAVLAGKLTLAELEEAQNPEWTPHGWPDIHPTQDIEGRIKARDAGFTSTSAIISRSGEDPKRVLQQRKDDELSGLTPPPAPAPGAAAAPAPQPDPDAQAQMRALLAGQAQASQAVLALAQSVAAKPAQAAAAPAQNVESLLAPIAALVASQAESMAATQQALLALATALANKPTEVNVAAPAVSVAAPAVSVTNNVEPTPVQVQVTNNVEPTPVQVEVNNQNDVHVPEGAVKVELPDRQIETDMVERDRDGNIKRVVQTERTIN